MEFANVRSDLQQQQQSQQEIGRQVIVFLAFLSHSFYSALFLSLSISFYKQRSVSSLSPLEPCQWFQGNVTSGPGVDNFLCEIVPINVTHASESPIQVTKQSHPTLLKACCDMQDWIKVLVG